MVETGQKATANRKVPKTSRLTLNDRTRMPGSRRKKQKTSRLENAAKATRRRRQQQNLKLPTTIHKRKISTKGIVHFHSHALGQMLGNKCTLHVALDVGHTHLTQFQMV